MNRILSGIMIFVLTAYLSACQGSQIKTQDAKKNDVAHEVTYTHKGTRSEGKSGYLTVDGIKIPDTFSYLLCGGELFKFHQKFQAWGIDGYFPTQESAASVFPSGSAPDAAAFAAGWADVSGTSRAIPANWIYVKWNNGMAAVSPAKIEDFVKEKKLERLQRRIISFKNRK